MRTDLDAKTPPVDIVAQKEIGRVFEASADFKEFHEVVLVFLVGDALSVSPSSKTSGEASKQKTHILSMNITTD